MTDLDTYLHRTYGDTLVYDAELGAWREPMTAAEVRGARQIREHLKHSLVETSGDVSNGVSNQS